MKKIYLSILFFLFFSFYAQSQCRYYNRVDKEGKKTGIWFSYWDASQKVLHRKFYYKDDREARVCKMYNREGKLMTKERHLKNRIKVKNYNESGKIQRKGWARIDFNTDDIHFYWHGRWKFFDQKHHLTGISLYEEGYFIESIENKRIKKYNQKTPIDND